MIWRDDTLFEELGPQDADVLVQTVGANHFFPNSRDGGFTIHGCCGHISKGEHFHWLCRACQLLSTRKLCCIRKSKACEVGS